MPRYEQETLEPITLDKSEVNDATVSNIANSKNDNVKDKQSDLEDVRDKEPFSAVADKEDVLKNSSDKEALLGGSGDKEAVLKNSGENNSALKYVIKEADRPMSPGYQPALVEDQMQVKKELMKDTDQVPGSVILTKANNSIHYQEKFTGVYILEHFFIPPPPTDYPVLYLILPSQTHSTIYSVSMEMSLGSRC